MKKVSVEIKAQADQAIKAMENFGQSLEDVAKEANDTSKELENTGKKEKETGNEAEKAKKKLDGMNTSLNKVGKAAQLFAASAIGQKIAGFAAEIAQLGINCIQSAAQMKQYEIAFTTMLNSADQGKKMLQDLKQFAASTPFDVPGVVSAGQQLMAFGFQAQEIIPMLTSLGDAAAGLGKGSAGVGQIAYAMGQMRTSGTLKTQDMMQLTNAGINAWQMLADASGKTIMEIKDLTEKGAIDSASAVEIIVAGMNAKFGGMMQKTSTEVAGLLANIEETAGNTVATVGEYMIKAFDVKGILTDVSDALGTFQQKMQDAADEGKSFSEVIKDCVPASVVAATGALAGAMGVVLYGAITAAVTALGGFITVSAGVVAAFAGIGAAIASVIIYWDEICEAMNAGMQAIGTIIVGGLDAIGEAFVWMAKGGVEVVGWLFEQIGGYCPEWLSNFNSMLDSAIESIRSWAREAIGWFQEVFKVKANVMNDSYWQMSMDNTDDDNKDGESNVGIPKVKRELFTQNNKDKTGTENKALRAAQEENKIKQERLKIADSYAKLKLQKEKDLLDSQLAIAKQYGTDEQKLNVQLAEIAMKEKQSLLDEELSYKEQVLAIESAMKEAALRKDGQKEIDMLKERLALLKESHDYTIENILQTTANSANAAKASYSNQQIGWQAQYNTSSTVDQMTMDNEKYKEEETAKANQLANEQEKLSVLEQINQRYDEQKNKINTISQIQQTTNQLAKDFSGGIAEWITGAKSFGEVMSNVLKNLIAQLIQAAIYATIVAACTGGGGGFAARWNTAFGKGFAGGGLISGPGSGTSDSIPVMLSNGEYVMNASAVDRIGLPLLNSLNSGRLDGFAAGGYICHAGYSNEGSTSNVATAPSNSFSINVQAMDAESFGGFLNRGGMNQIAQAIFDRQREFATEAGTW